MRRDAENSGQTGTTRSTVVRTVAVCIIIGGTLAALAWSAWEIAETGEKNAVGTVEQVHPEETQTPSAEDRASDALTKIIIQQQSQVPKPSTLVPEVKVDPAPRLSTSPQALPATTVRLNCARLSKAYSDAELSSMKEYQQLCK